MVKHRFGKWDEGPVVRHTVAGLEGSPRTSMALKSVCEERSMPYSPWKENVIWVDVHTVPKLNVAK
jgi:hypothetical protein